MEKELRDPTDLLFKGTWNGKYKDKLERPRDRTLTLTKLTSLRWVRHK